LPPHADDTRVTSDDHAAAAALQAVARLLSSGTGEIRAAVLDEARALLGADAAALIALDGPARTVSAADSPELASLLEQAVATLLIVPLADEALLLGGGAFTDPQVALATAFGAAAGATLGHGQAADEQARQVERQAALTRAAKSLHESLDLETLLTRICREALSILDADLAVVYRGTPDEGLHVAATAGAPPEMVGIRLEPGIGLAGKVLQSGEPMLTNDYLSIAALPPAPRSSATTPRSRSPSSGARSCVGSPPSATRARTTSARTTSRCSRPSPNWPLRPAATPASTPRSPRRPAPTG
jgi:hypothetical protein